MPAPDVADSFLTCCAVKSDFIEGTPYTVVKALEKKEAGIFVQHICQAISDIDTSRKLDGVMVAGYINGVYVSKSGTKTSEQRDEARYRMRPTLPVNPTKPTKAEAGEEYAKAYQDAVQSVGI
jgi:hypothetical protein